MATRVVDLTNKESNLRPVATKSLPNVDFLEEVFICNAYRCVYFKDKSINPDGTYFFEMGVLKLPADFCYVDYKFENGVLYMPDKSTLTTRDYDLYSAILLKMSPDEATPREHFHLCLNDDADSMVRAYGLEACAQLVTPRLDSTKFILFYYEGTLKFYNGERTGSFYLIAMVLSERAVIYYAIDTPAYGENTEKIEKWLKLLEEDPTRVDKIRIDEPIQINDKMGIWVFPQAEFAN